MTWLVPWNGKDYDVDPLEFDQLELAAIKDRSSLTFRQLLNGALNLDGDAIRALFWTVDRRDNPDLKFSDYRGPSVRVLVPHLGGLAAVAGELGKALMAISDGLGSDPSPNGSDTPPTSSTS